MKFLVLYLCFTPIFGIIPDESHMEGAAPPKGEITAPRRIDDRGKFVFIYIFAYNIVFLLLFRVNRL